MNGFAVSANSGNALMYFNLNDFQTRLEVHYRRKNGGAPDTTFAYFFYNNGSGGSSAPDRGQVANNIVRNRLGLPTGSEEILLQTTPGTYANLSIPELQLFQPGDPPGRDQCGTDTDNPIYDTLFKAPNYLYLDLIDSSTASPKWKAIYYDLNPSSPYDPDYKSGLPFFPSGGSVDFGYFGGYLRKRPTALR